jgi:hypothetical protein
MFHFRETKDAYKEITLPIIYADDINMADICKTSALNDTCEEYVGSNRWWALKFEKQQKFKFFWRGGRVCYHVPSYVLAFWSKILSPFWGYNIFTEDVGKSTPKWS